MVAWGPAAERDNDLFVRLCLRSRWEAAALDEAAKMASQGRVDWSLLCDEVRAGGLAPLVYDVLRGSQWVPETAAACLRDSYYETATFAGVMSVELGYVLRLLEKAGLPVIVLKGAALGDTLYGNSALRPMTDLDLLLHDRDISAALDVLHRNGYRTTGVEVRTGHTLEYENELVVYSPGTPPMAVELHWRLLDSPFYQDRVGASWFWETAQPALVAGTGALVLGMEAAILHLSAHYVLHHRAQGVRWIYDIALLVESFGNDIDWQLVFDKATEFELIYSIQVVVQQLVDDWQVAFPADVVSAATELTASEEEQRVVHLLLSEQRPVVQRFWSDLSTMSSWRRRSSYLLANLFPSPAYMQDRYDLHSRGLLPLAYPYRWALGLGEFLTTRRKEDDK